jgi:hypothetical protein
MIKKLMRHVRVPLPITWCVADHIQHVSISTFSDRKASTNFPPEGFKTCCKKA